MNSPSTRTTTRSRESSRGGMRISTSRWRLIRRAKTPWTAAVVAMKQMVADQDAWTGRCERSLHGSSPNSRASGASPPTRSPEITEESFARRIELRTIAMDADGSFSAYFDDDDMFFGHCVTAYGTLTDGVTAANMEG